MRDPYQKTKITNLIGIIDKKPFSADTNEILQIKIEINIICGIRLW